LETLYYNYKTEFSIIGHGFTMENEENVAYLARTIPQISQDGQDCLKDMADTMLSIQKSEISSIPDYKDQVKLEAQVYPKISPHGQKYLDKITHTFIQNPAVAPVHDTGLRERGKKAEGDLK
jgi:hypothetical protein